MTEPRWHGLLDACLEHGLLPDAMLRIAGSMGAAARLRRERAHDPLARARHVQALVTRMSTGHIAEAPEIANRQHYELPAEFFATFLGPRMKYSSSLWDPGTTELAAAEEAMLATTCRRAQVEAGMTVLDLGCGWGSLAIWLAEREGTHVVAVSNSSVQRAWIEAERDRRGLQGSIEVVTADVNDFEPDRRFDRVLSVEMFEHLRNWDLLLERIESWLAPEGRLFVHVFAHRDVPYRFEGTWAADRFFSGGTMPSHELLLAFDRSLAVEQHWMVDGTHYARTLDSWLARLDENAEDAASALRAVMPTAEAKRMLATWRFFLIGTARMWGRRQGSEWGVSHYRLARRGGHGANELDVERYSE